MVKVVENRYVVLYWIGLKILSNIGYRNIGKMSYWCNTNTKCVDMIFVATCIAGQLLEKHGESLLYSERLSGAALYSTLLKMIFDINSKFTVL